MHAAPPTQPPGAHTALELAHSQQHAARAQALASAACAGLRQALMQAPMVVVCAVGAAYEAALCARAPYSAVALVPVWVTQPGELEAMGAGLWRLTQLLVVSYGADAAEDEARACQAIALVAQRYHCPILALTPAGAPPMAAAAHPTCWSLPTLTTAQTSAQGHAAFALPYLGHLALAHAAARLRAPEFVASMGEQAAAAAALEQALIAYPAHADGVATTWSNDNACGALTKRCAEVGHLQLCTPQWQLMPALRAAAAGRLHVEAAASPQGAAAPNRLCICIEGAALHLRFESGPTVVLPLPQPHEALDGLWAHLALGLLLPSP